MEKQFNSPMKISDNAAFNLISLIDFLPCAK